MANSAAHPASHVRRFRSWSTAWILALIFAGSAAAQVPIERVGRVEVLPKPLQAHWLWIADAASQRISLLDLEDGTFLGQINTGWGMPVALFARSRPEIYLTESYYSRGTRGERTSVATIYDADTLGVAGEVVLPPKLAINPLPIGNAALSDDDRFLAAFNMTPATSLSVVDLEARTLAAEISTPGCALVYPVGARRFAAICGDGSLLVVQVDDAGNEAGKLRTAAFFDPESDPVTEKGARWGSRWIFASFEGYAHVIDFSGEEPQFEKPWSLLTDEDRAESWRAGGPQHLAVHAGTGRLYSLVHQGETDSHKSGGTELWVYDLAERKRVQRIELRNAGFTFMGAPMAFGEEGSWSRAFYEFLIDRVLPTIPADQVAVTQDDEPLLITASQMAGAVAIYDAQSGAFLRRHFTGNMSSQILMPPPWGAANVSP